MTFTLPSIWTKQRVECTFEKYIYVLKLISNIIMAIMIFATCFFLCSVSPRTLAAEAPLLIFSILVVFVVFDLILHTIITKDLSDEILHWQSTGLDIEYRTLLLSKVHKYPVKKAIQLQALFVLEGTFLALYLYYVLHADIHVTILFALAYITISYAYNLISMTKTEVACNKIAVEIIKQGVEVKPHGKSKKHFLGVSIQTSFLLHIIIYSVLSTILIGYAIYFCYTPLTIHANGLIASRAVTAIELIGLKIKALPSRTGSLIRLISITALNIGFYMYLSAVYFSRVVKRTSEMETSLIKLKEKNLDSDNLFPVDLGNETSYSLYLINKVLIYFDSLIKRNITANAKINESIKKLSGTSKKTQENIFLQSANIEEILATMQNVDFLSKNVEKKIDEVITVASKTLNNVETIFSGMTANQKKMKDISETNQITIENMQALCDKINSIQDVINVIDTVAEQTKTIAFSAELEANNLEATGYDFNNVATEIRNLTNSILDLTHQVRDQIKDISMASTNLIISGDSCLEKTNEGNELGEKFGQKFGEIKASAMETAVNSTVIKDSIHEQTSAFHEIVQTLTAIATSVKSFSESTTEISGTIDRLKENSSHILSLNNKYKIESDENSEGAYNEKL